MRAEPEISESSGTAGDQTGPALILTWLQASRQAGRDGTSRRGAGRGSAGQRSAERVEGGRQARVGTYLYLGGQGDRPDEGIRMVGQAGRARATSQRAGLVLTVVRINL